MNIDKLKLRVDLIKSRVEILKLKANDYEWQCHVPDAAKEGLEKALLDIDQALTELDKSEATT